MSNILGSPNLSVAVQAGGNATVGDITVINNYNIRLIGFFADNRILDIVKNEKISAEINKLLDSSSAKDKDLYMNGAFAQALGSYGVQLPADDLALINKKFAAGLSHCQFSNEADLSQAFENCSKLLDPSRNRSDYTEAERDRWAVDAGIANQIASFSYNDARLREIRKIPGINDGAIAILDSINYHATGDLVNLQENILRLFAAFDCCNSDYSKALIFGRIIVNSNLLSDYDLVKDYVDRLDFGEINDGVLAAKLLDAYATLTFNKLTSDDFPTFEGADLNKLIDAWNARGVLVADKNLDRDYIENFGLHIFTIQQLRYFSRCKDANESTANFSLLSNLRRQMIEDFLEAVDFSSNLAEHHNIARDFFGSLQRPAFHALICNDLDHLIEILDIYFGRNGRTGNDTLAKARVDVLKTKGLNRQWMGLLDIASKNCYRKSEAKDQFEYFMKNYLVSSKTPLVKNQMIMRTIPHIADAVGYDGVVFARNNYAIQSSKISEPNLHRAYGKSIIDLCQK